jgi:hypothetical protein
MTSSGRQVRANSSRRPCSKCSSRYSLHVTFYQNLTIGECRRAYCKHGIGLNVLGDICQSILTSAKFQFVFACIAAQIHVINI